VSHVLSYEHNEESTARSKHSFVESPQEHSAIFVERFLRSYRFLLFIAGRVLGDEERSSIAIQHCWRTAWRNPRHFEHEGAFRSWLVRVLIDEALAILCEKDKAEDSAPDVVNTVSR
jgi:DNA-directed RNA polymerase specialized sigma24 family protein